MTTVHRDPLVDAYLRRLDAAARDLPAGRRAELSAELEEHIEDALREAGARDEATVRNVLDRLGPPEEIAAAAGASGAPAPEAARAPAAPPTPPPAQPAREAGPGALEVAGMVALALNPVMPAFGFLIAAALVIASGAWSAGEKLVALLLPPLIFALGGFFVVALTANGFNHVLDDGGLGPFEVGALAAGNFFSGLIAALFLYSRLPRSPRT